MESWKRNHPLSALLTQLNGKDKFNGSQNPLLIYKLSLNLSHSCCGKIPRGQDKVGALQKGMPQQTPLTEKDHVMYKHTFIPILILWQGCPVQVSDVLLSRGHEVMDVLLNT